MHGLALGEGGVKLRGKPLGSQAFKRDTLDRQVVRIKYLLEALPTLDDPNMKSVLLHFCFRFPKFAFSIRTTDTSVHNQVRREFDGLVHQALEEILRAPLTIPSGSRPPCLPPREGSACVGLRPTGRLPTLPPCSQPSPLPSS